MMRRREKEEFEFFFILKGMKKNTAGKSQASSLIGTFEPTVKKLNYLVLCKRSGPVLSKPGRSKGFPGPRVTPGHGLARSGYPGPIR